jgi:hypothetical protein
MTYIHIENGVKLDECSVLKYFLFEAKFHENTY